jgi:hypothetical protein
MLSRQIGAWSLLFLAMPAAADFIIDSPLNFGEIAIRSNASVSTLTVYRNGASQSTNHIFIIKQGSPGVFTLNGLPPYTTVNLSVDLPAISATPYPDTAQFSLTAVDIPASINMGATGSAQFKLGGTLSTSGNPANNYYSGAVYTVYLNINIDY